MKRKTAKLSLFTRTIRTLTASELGAADGGMATFTGKTFTCECTSNGSMIVCTKTY